MAALIDAVIHLRDSVGEFEKPKFFDYKQKICAHTRNGQIGCTACIDVCSAQAIRSDELAVGLAGTLLGEAGGIFLARAALGAVVFADPAVRARLEAVA